MICFIFLPETPRALIRMERWEEARNVVCKVYGDNREWVDYEMAEITAANAIEKRHLAKMGQ